MKCSNPECNRGLGLVAHQRGLFDKRRYCSKRCRDTFVTEWPKRSQQERGVTTYFEWLLLRPIETRQLKPALVRVRARSSTATVSGPRP